MSFAKIFSLQYTDNWFQSQEQAVSRFSIRAMYQQEQKLALALVLCWLIEYSSVVWAVPQPVAIWPMTSETGADDVSGYNNNGMMGSDLSFAPGVHGDQGGALYFPGHSLASKITVPINAGSSMNLSLSSFSVTGFFQQRESGLGGPILLFFNGELMSAGSHVWLRDITENMKLRIKIKGVTGSTITRFSNPYFMEYDKWVFFACSYDRPGGSLKFWKNGELQRAATGIGTMEHQTTGAVVIGALPFNLPIQTLRGNLACLQLIGDALSNQDVLELMEQSADGCPCKAADLKSKRFRRRSSSRMDGAVMTTLYVRRKLDCASACGSTCGCVSYNLQISGSNIWKLCELNRWSSANPSSDLGFAFYKMRK